MCFRLSCLFCACMVVSCLVHHGRCQQIHHIHTPPTETDPPVSPDSVGGSELADNLYYVRELFHKYGANNNTISLKDFQTLLQNLQLKFHLTENNASSYASPPEQLPARDQLGGDNYAEESSSPPQEHHIKESDGQPSEGASKQIINSSSSSQPNELLHHHSHHKCLGSNSSLALMPFFSNATHQEAADATITSAQFIAICPALVYHLDQQHCKSSSELFHHVDDDTPSPLVWLYATLAVAIISLCGLLSVAIIPIMQRVFYQSLLQFLVGLAIGSLSGDALLHLLPHAMSSSHHHSDNSDHHHDDLQVWRGLAALGGAFIFFLAERLLNIATSCHSHSHSHSPNKPSLTAAGSHKSLQSLANTVVADSEQSRAVGEKLSHHKHNSYTCPMDASTLESLQSLNPAGGDHADYDIIYNGVAASKEDPSATLDSLSPACDCHHHSSNGEDWDSAPTRRRTVQVDLSYVPTTNPPVGDTPATTVEECHRETVVYRHAETDHSYVVTVTDHHHHHSHAGNTVSAVAWMVVVGDALHNFCDGLAIGAAFAADISGGISTTIAVFCHELPHELGDFAMLIKSGMSVRQALTYNGVSSALCLVGMTIGILLGNIHSSLGWIFAGAAGMFLYIAFVDMVPELSSGPPNGGHNLALQLLGITLGVSIMLVIAVYEHELRHIVS